MNRIVKRYISYQYIGNIDLNLEWGFDVYENLEWVFDVNQNFGYC